MSQTRITITDPVLLQPVVLVLPSPTVTLQLITYAPPLLPVQPENPPLLPPVEPEPAP